MEYLEELLSPIRNKRANIEINTIAIDEAPLLEQISEYIT